MCVTSLIAGGMLYIDDKARGVHEGIPGNSHHRLELVLGLNRAGAIKAVSGACIVVIAALAIATPLFKRTL